MYVQFTSCVYGIAGPAQLTRTAPKVTALLEAAFAVEIFLKFNNIVDFSGKLF